MWRRRHLGLAVVTLAALGLLGAVAVLRLPTAVVVAAAGLAAFAVLAAQRAAWFRSERVLGELTDAVEHVTAGRRGHSVFPAVGGAAGELAAAFNRMSERLAEQFALLEADRERLRTILGGMVEGVIAIDAQQRLLYANERAADLFGFLPQSAFGRRLWEVVRQRRVQECVERALAGSEAVREELDWFGDAEKSISLYAVRLPGSPAPGAVLVAHDVSDLRRLERLRQEFVANVSHELKTPLSAIKANVETLLDGAIDDVAYRTDFLEQISDQSDRLHALILDLLSLARIEGGAETLEFQAVSLEEAVADCIARHRRRAEAKRQTLLTEPPTDSPAGSVWADAEALDQILDNLVDNAIKYTPEGGRITVRRQARGDHLCLEVEDTGIGIPERDLP